MSATGGGAPPALRRWLAVGVAGALLAGSAAYLARRGLDDGATPAGATGPTLPPVGMVVSLERAGGGDLAAALGPPLAFHAGVVGTEPIVAVELWSGGTVVDRVVAGDGDERTGRADRLTWRPAEEGAATLVARAIDAKGRVGQSNPVRVEVAEPMALATYETHVAVEGETLDGLAEVLGHDGTVLVALNPGMDPTAALVPGTEVLVPTAITAADVPASLAGTLPPDAPAEVVAAAREADAGAVGRGRGLAPRPGGGDVPELVPLPPGLALAAAPELSAVPGGCGAVVTVELPGGAEGTSLTLLRLGPGGSGFEPVAELGTAGPGERVTATVDLPSAGTHTLVVAAGAGGVLTAWSPLVDVEGGGGCEGWEGDARLVDGRLVADADPGADLAYLYLSAEPYLSSDPGRWVRVPPTGFVPRAADGRYDFRPHLPDLDGRSLQLRAWGRRGGALVPVGTGRYTPPPGHTSLPPSIFGSVVRLDWIEQEAKAGAPEKLAALGTVEELGVERFRWSTKLLGVTHGVWQVTAAPVAPGAGPDPGGVLLTGKVTGSGGTFAVDLGQLVDQAAAGGGSTTSTVAAPTGSQAVKAGSLGYQDLVVAGPVGPITTATASPVPLDLDLGPGFDEGLGVELHVRVLPFSGDTYLGSVSNDVVLQTPDPESVAAAEALGEPEPPPGQKHYDLDVTLLSGPRPPDPRYMTCWQFVTWDWEKVDLSLFFQPDGPYKTWFWFTQAVGTNPICAGCYDFGSTKVALAGTSCDDGGFLDFLWESAKAFVDTLSSTFAFIKSALVDVVVTATGCKAAGGGSVCSTLAGVALDAALISLGIPPTLPDWDQLVASMKGDIVALGVSLAEQAGVPCDEASFATEIHGQDQFSCEAALSALVDEAVDQVDQAFADAANQMGFGFPPGMVVKPHPQGQVAPARVRIDVRQTDPKVTTLTGTTCDAGVFTTGWWAAKPSWLGTLFGKPASPSVVVEEVAPAWFAQYSQIPQAFWYGPPFELVNWRLPDLKKPAPFTPLVPASRTYSLYPPTTYELVPVAQFGPPSSFPGQSAPPTVTKLWYQWPRHVFLLNEGATFKLTVLSPCASGETHTYTLPGYAPGLAQEVGS